MEHGTVYVTVLRASPVINTPYFKLVISLITDMHFYRPVCGPHRAIGLLSVSVWTTSLK